MYGFRRLVLLAAGILALAGIPGAAAAAGASPHVLRVGTYHGIPGQYASIQAAVDAAQPGDFVLVGPGDYKTTSSRAPSGAAQTPAAVLITTPGISLRGMDRNAVVIDGTRSGPPCSTAAADQNFGPSSSKGALGLNGVMVWKADNVSVENLTTCNFLAGAGEGGNGVWWNGGDGSGQIGGKGFWGRYLTATSTYFHDERTAAAYGIFSSNWNGGTFDVGYASNFNDSGYYIGACQQQCNQVVNHAWAEYSALGYSGSNSGGSLIIENSVFDKNQDGFDTNSQNGDNPPPQDGSCPGGAISPITHTTSCWVFMHNHVYDNNNPNVPTAGSAAAGPVGTGISLSGGRNDTVMDNVFDHNNAWGLILVPYPDSGSPCTGGTQANGQCLFDEYGDAVLNNQFGSNGSFGNPTNGDIGVVNTQPGPTDCFSGNTEIGGGSVTTSPPLLQTLYPTCTGQPVPPDANPVFLDEVACDSEGISISGVQGSTLCPPGANYPRKTAVLMQPLPGAVSANGLPALENPASSTLTTMASPCRHVPVNPWCPRAAAAASGSPSRTATQASSGLASTGGSPALPLLSLGLMTVAGVEYLRRRRSRRQGRLT